MEDDYKYQFKYIDGSTNYCTEFQADRDLKYIVSTFKRFLISAGWYSKKVNRIQIVDEEVEEI